MKQQEAQVDSEAQESKLTKLLARLSRVRRSKGGYTAICPAHNERTGSLKISVAEDDDQSKILLKCFGVDCKADAIVEAVGLTMSDLFDDKGKIAMMPIAAKGKKYNSIEEIKSGYKTLEDAYEYNYLGEEPCYLQVRFTNKDGNKDFHTYHLDDNGFWYSGKGEGLIPLYNIDEIAKSKSVLIVEGEKVVKLLKEYGIPATTSLGGSNAAENTDWTSLRDNASVVMWRDNDDPGLKYQQTVNRILNNIGVNLRKVEVEKLGLEKGDDLEEYIDMHPGDRDQVRGKIYSCLPKLEANAPVNFLNAHLEKVRKGEIQNLDIPFFPMLTEYGQMFQPGAQVLLYSQPGTGKTLFSGRIADEWALTGKVRVKRLLLESSLSFHLLRSLAQVSARTEVLKTKFHFENPEESKRIVEQYAETLNTLGQTMTTADHQSGKKITEWSETSIIQWIRKNAKDHDVLIVDPISRILSGAVWEITNRITAEAEAIMQEFPHLCILWIHHPDAENNISGGKGWTRFSSSIIEIVKLEEPQDFEVADMHGDSTTMAIERYIRIRKARSGEGMDYKLAIKLDPTDLTLKEIGRIIRKVK